MAHALEEMSRVTDAELVRRLDHLVKVDRALCAKLLVHLSELEGRKLYLARGYSSMYDYCRTALCMSDAETYTRLKVAKICRQFPIVLERLAAGSVHLSAIKLLAPYLSADNHLKLLDRAHGRTKQQIALLIAELDPKPDAPARLRKLPTKLAPVVSTLLAGAEAAAGMLTLPLSATTQSPTLALPSSQNPSDTATLAACALQGAPVTSEAAAPFALQSPRTRGSTKPLSPGRFKLEVTLGQDAHDKLQQLQELLRHQNPSGDLARIVERALRELLEREMKRRFAQTSAPRRRVAHEAARSGTNANTRQQPVPDPQVQSGTGAPSQQRSVACAVTKECMAGEPVGSRTNAENERPDEIASASQPMRSRYIPRDVMREVYARDAGQCTFVSPEGCRCTARGFLELDHHRTTFARGGEPTADNLRLACRAHNIFLAQKAYGRDFMQAKLQVAATQRARSTTQGT